MQRDDIRTLEKSNYISFATRRKSGEWVATPVWFAPDGDSYFLFSAGDAGKVKRLRNFSLSRIAPCTMRGKLTGDWIDTEAYLLESRADRERALRALRRKYGLQMLIADFFASLTGRMHRRAYIRVDLTLTGSQ